MAIFGDALRQAFMPESEYNSLREEQKAWGRLQRPLVLLLATVLCIAVVVAVSVSLAIVFPGESNRRPFCRDRGRIQALRLANVSLDAAADSESYHGAFYLTDEEAADYYWMVVFLPSAIVFSVSTVYLSSGQCQTHLSHSLINREEVSHIGYGPEYLFLKLIKKCLFFGASIELQF